MEWLGEIPEHWEVRRLAYSALRSDNAIEPEGTEELPYIGLEHVESWTGQLHRRNGPTESDITSNSFANGDVLFGKLRPYLAKAFSAEFNGLCSTEFLVLKPHGYKQRYLLYLLLTREFVSLVDSSTYGAKMPRANWDIVGQSLLPVPPFDEQRAIATFLDRETKRIDSLAEKMRLLIDRLGEYRTALITRTVTRGLPAEAARLAGVDPSPRLKPSGMEFLGDVPEHWEVKRLSLIGTFFKGGGGTKEDEVEDGVPCVRYGDIYTQHQYFIRETRSDISEESAAKYTPIHYGDILFAGSGETLEEIGKSAANLIEGPAYCGGDVIVLRPVIEFDATFLGYAADCSTSTYQKAYMGRGVTVMHIYGQELKRLVLPLPPIDEQQAIGAFLDRETERIDSLAAKMRLLIERLSEHRTALITAAVTGKIDVRVSAESPKAPLRSRQP